MEGQNEKLHVHCCEILVSIILYWLKVNVNSRHRNVTILYVAT